MAIPFLSNISGKNATFAGQVKTTSASGFLVDAAVDMSMSYYTNVPSTSWGIFSSNNHGETIISTNLKVDSNHDVVTNQTHSVIKGSGIVFTGNGHHAGAGAIAMYALGNGSATAGTVTAEESYALLIKDTAATFTGNIIIDKDSTGQNKSSKKLQFKGTDGNSTEKVQAEIITISDTNVAPSGGMLKFRTSSDDGTVADALVVDGYGFVGIGTTSPVYKLDVIGDISTNRYIRHNSDTNTYFGFGGNDTIQFNTNGSERLRITSGGNVGIGTTSPGVPLDVFGNLGIRTTVNSGALTAGYFAQLRSDYGENSLRLASRTGDVFRATNYGAAVSFLTGNPTSEKMRITSTGNVGIGTTSPGAKFEVGGTSAMIWVNPPDGSHAGVNFRQAGTFKGFVGYNDSTDVVNLSMDGSIVNGINVNSSHNVGIGTTSPDKKLEVSGDIKISGGDYNGLYFENAGGTTKSLLYQHANNDALVIKDIVNNADRFTFTNSGNLGIGTPSPGFTLHLSTTSPSIVIEDTDATNTYNITRINGAGGNLSFDTRRSSDGAFVSTDYQIVKDTLGANYQRWFTAGSERLRITSNGNVGIGETSADAKLHISDGTTPNIKFERPGNKKWAMGISGTNFIIDDVNDNLSTYVLKLAADNTATFAGNIQVGGFDDGSNYSATIGWNAVDSEAVGTKRSNLTFETGQTSVNQEDIYKWSIAMIAAPATVSGEEFGSDLAFLRSTRSNTYTDEPSLTLGRTGDATFAGGVTVEGGTLDLGKADTASGHINAKELMTFNIDTDNDDTNRYFAWYTNSSSGSGTELLKISETGAATFAGNVDYKPYPMPSTGSTAGWYKVGTLSSFPQNGNVAVIEMEGHAGYNAANNQDFCIKIYFKTSNGNGGGPNNQNFNSWYERTGLNSSHIEIVWKTSATNVYDLYMYLPVHTLGGFYKVRKRVGSWAHSAASASDPGANSSTILEAVHIFNVDGDLTVSGTSSTFNTGNSGTFTTSDSSNYPRFTMTNASAQIGLFRAGSNAGGMYIGGAGDGLRLYTSSFSQKLFIDTNGNATFAGTVTSGNDLTAPGDLSIRNITASGTGLSTIAGQLYVGQTSDYFGSNTNIQLNSGGSSKSVGIRSQILYLYSHGNNTTSKLIFGDGSANFGLFSNDTEFALYNYGTASNSLLVNRSTNAATFAGAVEMASGKITSDGSAAAGAYLELKHANNNSTDVCATINLTNNAGGYAAIEGGTSGANNTGYISFKTDNAGTQGSVLQLNGDKSANFFGNVDIYTGTGLATLNIGRNANEKLQIDQTDNETVLTAYNDSDSDGAHNFRLNRVFQGSGANNFKIQKGGTDQFTIDTNANATFAANINVGGTMTMSASGNIFSDSVFQFLNTGSGAQYGRFRGIQVSTSYGGTTPSQGILFGTDTNLYRDSSNVLKTDDSLIVSGDLTVNGTTTTINTTTVEVEDNILQLNTTQGSPDTATAATSGISVYRGNGVTQASLIFDDADDTWDLTDSLKVASGVFTNSIYLTDKIRFLNKVGDGWLTLATINTSASEAVYDLTTIGTISASGTATFGGDVYVDGGDIWARATADNTNSMLRATSSGSGGIAGIGIDAANGDFAGSDYFTIRQLDNKQIEFNARTNTGNTLFFSKGALNLTQNGANSTFAGTVYIPSKLEHTGDSDTFLNFSDDTITLSAGGTSTTFAGNGNATFAGDMDISGTKITMDTIMLQDAGGGRLGFNRDTSNGNIHDSSYNAYQIQNNTGASQGGKLEIQEYNSNGVYAGSTFITGSGLQINDYIVHNGDDSKIGFEGNDAIRMYTANTVQLQISDNKVGIGTTSPTYKLSVNGAISGAGFVTYTKSYGSLNATGNAVAGITADANGNGSSCGFTFTCFGHTGAYQRVVYSCYNGSGTWHAKKVIDEGTNQLDVEASASGSTITFTFKATSSTMYYSPRVKVEAEGHNINSTYA
jgi:hypothetical protein